MLYLKNVILKYIETGEGERLLPVLSLLLQFRFVKVQFCPRCLSGSRFRCLTGALLHCSALRYAVPMSSKEQRSICSPARIRPRLSESFRTREFSSAERVPWDCAQGESGSRAIKPTETQLCLFSISFFCAIASLRNKTTVLGCWHFALSPLDRISGSFGMVERNRAEARVQEKKCTVW